MATFACRLTLDRPRIVERDDGLEPTVGVLALDDFLITFYHYLGEFHTVPLPGPLCSNDGEIQPIQGEVSMYGVNGSR